MIRHARLDEKRKTYEWLCLSDTTPMHMGTPDYPENPIHDWEAFQEDFEDFYYSPDGRTKGSVMIIESEKEEIGCLCYANFHLKPNMSELDIWLKAKKYCGKGLGTEALKDLIKYLAETFSITKFIIRPSEKNIRAIRSYEKAGFKQVADKQKALEDYYLKEFMEQYGCGDYGLDDTAILTLEI